MTIPHHHFWKYCLPVTQNIWWYMTAYFGMYAFLPFVNKSLQNISKRELLSGGVLLLIVFSVIPCMVRNRCLFQLEQGYSVVWLLVCYCFGAILFSLKDDIDRFLKSNSSILAGLPLCICIVILVILTLLKDLWFYRFPMLMRINCLFDDYTSPLMVFYALALLLFSSRLDFPTSLQPFIIQLSSLTLPIYLIHVHPIIWQEYFSNATYRFDIQNYAT